jgi:hypothetical protein
MSKITYRVVKHDGGWAFGANGTYSEQFPTREAARKAARLAATAQAAANEITHGPHMKIKLDGGTTTAAAEGPSAPVAIRLSHSDVNRLAHWHAVRRNLGGD